MSLESLASVTTNVVEEIIAPAVSNDAVDDENVIASADPASRIAFWGAGRHEAIFTVLNGGDMKERVEQVDLTRKAHPRNNELLTLSEQGDVDVFRLRYESWTSLQALITECKRHGVVGKITYLPDHETSQVSR